MRLNKSMRLGAVLVLAGCGTSQVDSEYVEGTPDLAGVSLEVNGERDELSALTAEDFDGVYAQALAAGPEYLEGARAEVKALNAALKDAITRVTTLANGELQTAQKGQTVLYGPMDMENASFQLQVKKTAAKHFSWKLEARPLGSTDDKAWKLVGAGKLAKGELAHRGRGTLALNLDKLKEAAPATTGQGKLMVAFAHTAGEDKAVSYKLVGFTPNVAHHAPVTGAFVGYRLLPSRITALRVVGRWNLGATATGAEESVFTRIRFRPGVGGRADILATGGDIPDKHVFIGSACWDAQEKELFKVLRDCTKGATSQPGNCTVVFTQGDLRECRHADFRGDVEAPAENPDDTTQEPGAPTETPDEVPGDVTADF